jgi:lysozyme
MSGPPARPKPPVSGKGVALWLSIATASVGASEGYRQNAYLDPVNIPTACYGETRNIRIGMHFTLAECNTMLEGRLVEFDRGIAKCVGDWDDYSPNTRAAGVSLAYNIGLGAFCKSSVARLWNAGHIKEGCYAFLKWNKAGGVVFPGLTKRRQREIDLCTKDL